MAFQWVRFLVIHRGMLPWRNPATFTERLFVKMARDRDPLLTRTADKAGLRGYVQDVLGDGHLPALYAVLERPEELLEATLPSRYVVKATHSSGHVVLVPSDSLEVRQQVPLRASVLDHDLGVPEDMIERSMKSVPQFGYVAHQRAATAARTCRISSSLLYAPFATMA